MEWWKETGTTGPILLANKDNLDNTTCGVKATSIAGAIFNHKDDKKSQQHTSSWWCQNHGIPSTFPGALWFTL
jgi:hypothetical protein